MERFLKRTARVLDGQLAWQGHSDFKVGNVRAIGDRIAITDVVGIGGAVAQCFKVDRNTGTIDRVF